MIAGPKPSTDLRSLGRIGAFVANLSRFTIGQNRTIACELERMGYRSLSFGESLGREAFTQAAVLLQATRSIAIHTGIASIYGRDPWAMANAARTLSEAFPGRFVLGMGVSHATLVNRRGHAYTAPVTAMRAYLSAMPEAPWALPPPPNPPVVLAALRPRMLEVVRDAADGAQPYFMPVEHTRAARAIIGDQRWLSPVLSVVTSLDGSAARERARTHMRIFLKMANYSSGLSWMGWPQADLADAGSDALLDAIVVTGGTEAAGERLNEHIQAGADHVQVEVIADTFDDLMKGYEALAEHLF
jgi:probable F420-dependent oxidoreductase